jgi:hypothetical protein
MRKKYPMQNSNRYPVEFGLRLSHSVKKGVGLRLRAIGEEGGWATTLAIGEEGGRK